LFDTHDKMDRSCGGAEIAGKPAFGAAGVGGGEQDRTPLYDLGWREGVHDRAVNHQGPKVDALDSTILRDIKLTKIFAPPKKFPRYLPVTYVEIGRLSLGALPTEVSTTAALRIRSDFDRSNRYFQLVGLANEYSSYMATESE
jgi:hypothetical protein